MPARRPASARGNAPPGQTPPPPAGVAAVTAAGEGCGLELGMVSAWVAVGGIVGVAGTGVGVGLGVFVARKAWVSNAVWVSCACCVPVASASWVA